MWKPLFLSILLIGVHAAEDTYQSTPKAPVAQQPTTTKAPYKAPQQPGVKDGPARGRYMGGDDGGNEYDHHGYHHGGHRIFRGFDIPLVDDYICDMGATILVVTNSDAPHAFVQAMSNAPAAPAADAPADGDNNNNNNNYGRVKRSYNYGASRDNYGPSRDYPQRDYYEGRDHDGYGKERYDPSGRDYDRRHDYDDDHHYGHGPGVVANADRLRCAVIAGNDETSCTTCCQLSARRDRSISKDKIIGFLVDNNQLSYDAQAPDGGEGGYGDNYGDRKKRSDGAAPADATYYQYQAATVPASTPAPDVPTPDSDLRCVCCAPKRYRPFIFDRFYRRHHRYNHPRYGGPGPY